MAAKNSPRPQSAPALLPPGPPPDSGVGRSETMRGTHHIYVRRLGPVEIILGVVLSGAILAIGVALLFGLFLIAIPVMAALISIGIMSAVVRGYLHRQ